MQQSTYYQLSEPEYGENPDIALINGNMDVIDTALAKARARNTDVYSELTSYAVGDFCIYNDMLYKCTGATSGTWDSTKWTQTTIAAAFEPRHTWTLFETITADGNERAYDRQMPANVTGVLLRINILQASTASTVGLQVKHTGDTKWDTAASVSNGMATTEDRCFFIEYSKDGNLWRNTNSQSSAGDGAKTISSRYGTFKITNLALTDIRVVAGTSGAYFTQNSTIEIYIRR